jgi:hypothetical protein
MRERHGSAEHLRVVKLNPVLSTQHDPDKRGVERRR